MTGPASRTVREKPLVFKNSAWRIRQIVNKGTGRQVDLS